MTLLLSVVVVGAVLLAVAAAGWAMTSAFLPPDPAFRLERFGWSGALGCSVLVASVPLTLAAAFPPRAVLIVVTAVVAAILLKFRLPRSDAAVPRRFPAVALVVVALGVAFYFLRALTEPMWANDFIAIWGLKGKTIYGSRAYPDWLTTLEYAHPEYPLGLPLLYAGVSFAVGRWDDHAMALLFPLFQVGTLLVLIGWLRRRGVSPGTSAVAAVLVAWFEPLYSAFLTGMAEVPLAFGALLFGTALADALDDTDAGAFRRLTVAAALIAATKNEGLFLVVVGAVLALVFGKRRGWKIAMRPLAAALIVRALQWPWRSRIPLADFEAGLFSTSRVWDSLAAAGRLLGSLTWIGLALVAVLIAAGRSRAAGNRLLLLAAAGVAAYVLIPAFAVRGPDWLIETTFLRTTAALAPLAAAAVAVRYANDVSATVNPADP